jgi:ribonuclease BN (tRNA processing enzyme)
VVLATDEVTVTAFRTPHPPIVDSFAYKFVTPDGSIVFSSDTAYNPNLDEFARGADVLVLSHFVPGDDPLVTDADWTEGVKTHFSGRIIVARDLMELPLPV